MPDEGSVFDNQSVDRIARAVQAHERQITPTGGRRGRTPQILGGWQLFELVDLAPQYDPAEKAYKVQGRKVSDEKAYGAAFDWTAVPDDQKLWLWFPRTWSWEEGPDSGVPWYCLYQRVYAISRGGRKEIVATAGYRQGHWLQGWLEEGLTPPAHAVVKLEWATFHPDLNSTETDNSLWRSYRLDQFDEPTAGEHLLLGLLGPVAGYSSHPVPVTEARLQPAWGLKQANVEPNDDCLLWGPAPGSWSLWPGLPGFREVVARDDNFYGGTKVLVRAHLEPVYYALASQNWSKSSGSAYHSVLAHPCTPEKDYVYDGRTRYDVTLPDFEIEILFPQAMFTGSAPHSIRHPNVEEGDLITYRPCAPRLPGQHSVARYLAGADYLDDPIGTVKAFCPKDAYGAPVGVPRGWALMNGTDNSVDNGGSGLDLRGRFIVGYHPSDADFDAIGETGGAKTHNHGSGSGIEYGSYRSPVASHLPPYLTLALIERLDNSY